MTHMEKAMAIYRHEIETARLQGFFAGLVAGLVVGILTILALCD